MTNPEQIREVKEHAAAAKRAAEFFTLLAKSGDIPITPDNFKERVEEFFANLDERFGAANALVLAAHRDEWCPVSLFKPWASYATIRIWSMSIGPDRLPTQLLNGKLCVQPSAFFKALHRLGKAK